MSRSWPSRSPSSLAHLPKPQTPRSWSRLMVEIRASRQWRTLRSTAQHQTPQRTVVGTSTLHQCARSRLRCRMKIAIAMCVVRATLLGARHSSPMRATGRTKRSTAVQRVSSAASTNPRATSRHTHAARRVAWSGSRRCAELVPATHARRVWRRRSRRAASRAMSQAPRSTAVQTIEHKSEKPATSEEGRVR